MVAPRVGAWIETVCSAVLSPQGCSSHPVWVRGLKLITFCIDQFEGLVAPRVGAWIETVVTLKLFVNQLVAPRVGAWIET